MEAAVSICIPVFNQEKTIGAVLRSIADSISLPAELLVLDDGSEDGTLDNLIKQVPGLIESTPNLTAVKIFHCPWSRFETASDDFLFRQASAPFLMEVQADMFLHDKGFDRRMVSVMTSGGFLAVSGRGCHPLGAAPTFISIWINPLLELVETRFRSLKGRGKEESQEVMAISDKQFSFPEATIDESAIFPDAEVFLRTGKAGRLDESVEVFLDSWIPYLGRVFVGETIMRGPLLIDKLAYHSIGGFDTSRYFLGNDDHDLCRRAGESGWKVAFSPVAFTSRLSEGSTRRKRSLKSRATFLFHYWRTRVGIKLSSRIKTRRTP